MNNQQTRFEPRSKDSAFKRADAERDNGGRKQDLPEILVTDRPMRDVSLASLIALEDANEPPTLFVRAGTLVHLSTDEHGRERFKITQAPHLRGLMDRAADYRKETRGELKHVAPPILVVNDILSMPPANWPFPPLECHVEAPYMRRDGSIASKPGYDPESKGFYSPADGLFVPEIPNNPTRREVQNSVNLLKEVLSGFPFDNEASFANAVALLLTPCLRLAIDGQVPLALIDAPQAGTGKSLLASLVAEIATGGVAAMLNAPSDEEEWRKAITATLMDGNNIIIYDNLDGVLRSPRLAMALSARCWKDRILGVSQTIELPQKCTWIVTGNNIRLGGDLARRCYWIRLDSKLSRPWTRTEFRHTDLIGWVREHRGEILGALLTISRAWFAAGRPAAEVPTLGGFENWAKTMAGILAFAGVPGFLGNVQELYDLADDGTPQWEGFLAALHATYGDHSFTVAQLSNELQTNAPLRETLPDEISAGWGDGQSPSNRFKTKLGKAFRARVGTRFGADCVYLERAGAESRGQQVRWRVVRAGVQGSQGHSVPPTQKSSIDSEQHGRDASLLNLQPCEGEIEAQDTVMPTRSDDYE